MNSWWSVELGDGVDAAVAVAVLLLYGGAFVIGFRTQKMTAVDWLIGGICLTWTGTLIDRLWRLTYRVLHHPHWMESSPVLLISLVIVAIGGVLHISAKHENGGNAMLRSWRSLTLAIGSGLVLGLIAIWLTGEAKQGE